MPASYPLEFRREAVELLKRRGNSVPELARGARRQRGRRSRATPGPI